jgi:hypothetical protein
MKLHIVPARQGILWVKLGMRTFLRQPLALSGLFFIFMAVMSLLSMVPLIGNVLALALLPGATLGVMVATHETLCTHNPLGVKGCGEVGAIGSPPAVINAVVDALRDYGVTHVEMPATPAKLWHIINSGRRAAAE